MHYTQTIMYNLYWKYALDIMQTLRYTSHGKMSLEFGASVARKGRVRLPVKYEKLLNLLQERGYTTYRIRKENLMGQAALQKIRSGTGEIDTRTIAKICDKLGCQPGDIMEYVPESSSDT